MSGCSSVWPEHRVWGARAAGSTPAIQTISLVCADRIMGVRKVVALEAAGSIPRLRTISWALPKLPDEGPPKDNCLASGAYASDHNGVPVSDGKCSLNSCSAGTKEPTDPTGVSLQWHGSTLLRKRATVRVLSARRGRKRLAVMLNVMSLMNLLALGMPRSGRCLSGLGLSAGGFQYLALPTESGVFGAGMRRRGSVIMLWRNCRGGQTFSSGNTG